MLKAHIYSKGTYRTVKVDRTNGCAYAAVLCPFVCRLPVTYVLWLNGAS